MKFKVLTVAVLVRFTDPLFGVAVHLCNELRFRVHFRLMMHSSFGASETHFLFLGLLNDIDLLAVFTSKVSEEITIEI